MKSAIPKTGLWFISRLLLPSEREAFCSALKEDFEQILKRKGPQSARFWFWGQVFRSLPSFLAGYSAWAWELILSGLLTAWRGACKDKVTTSIHLFGFSVGLAACMLIFAWVHHHRSYDRFHTHFRRIYRVLSSSDNTLQANTPGALAPFLENACEGIEATCRYISIPGEQMMRYKDRIHSDDVIAYADPAFFRIFSFSFLSGGKEHALEERDSIVLTRSMASRYFGSEDPLGKTMDMAGFSLRVTGVIEDIPQSSHIRFNAVVPVRYWDKYGPTLRIWEWGSFTTYVLLSENWNAARFAIQMQEKIDILVPSLEKIWSLQPLNRIHLHSDIRSDAADTLPMQTVSLFTSVALLILLIGGINFTNLSYARNSNRSREIALRKIVGGTPLHIASQFLSESMVVALASFVLAVALAENFLPLFNRMMGVSIPWIKLLSPRFILLMLGLSLTAACLAALYPASILSSCQPSRISHTVSGDGFRSRVPYKRVLVLMQLVLTILLIGSGMIMIRQMAYIKNKPLGYDAGGVLVFQSPPGFFSIYEEIRNRWLTHPCIFGMGRATSLPRGIFHLYRDIAWPGREQGDTTAFHLFSVYYDAVETFGMKMTAGRSFSRKAPQDTAGILINETAARVLNRDPEKISENPLWIWNRPYMVIGIVKDFHQESLHKPIRPLIMMLETGFYTVIKTEKGFQAEVVRYIEDELNRHLGSAPVEIFSLEEQIRNQYAEERRMESLLLAFSVLALILSMAGLYGLSSILARRSIREVSIRKVLGGNTWRILAGLIRGFLTLLMAANTIGLPAAGLLMHRWLNRFSFRTEVGVLPYLSVFLCSLILGLGVVTVQTIRTARRNPADVLRSE